MQDASRIFWLWTAVGLAGCAHQKPAAPAAAPEVLDGAVVRTSADPLTGLETYDAERLFHLAGEAERQDAPDRARALYARLLAELPASRFAPSARFNLGLLEEAQEDWAAALVQYEALTAELPAAEARRLFTDAGFRRTVVLGELGRWWDAVGVFDGLLELEWLEPFDRLEALVGRGIALQEAGDPQSAELAFGQALRFYRDTSKQVRIVDNGLVAEAAFRMGRIKADQYAAVRLEFPVELLRQRLEEKCTLLLSAQSRFLRAIRYGDRHTVAAAGYQIGSLYEVLYDEVVGLETPPELDAQQAELYREEVRKRVRILLEKAIRIYEKSLLAGKSTPTAADWVRRLEAALARLRKLYLVDVGVEEQEEQGTL